MGPVISAASKSRIESLIAKGAQEGASVLVDGRGQSVAGYPEGYFVFPTILDGVPPQGEIARTEIFGPVLSLMHAATMDEAIALVNERSYGNMACLFTSDGANARRFRYEVNAGNVGINVGVAAPMAYFPFSGWGRASSATCMPKPSTAWSSTRRPRWWSNAGPAIGAAAFKPSGEELCLRS